MIKEIIKKILKEEINRLLEEMVPTDNKPHELGENNYVTIAQDNITNDFLLLFVELHEESDEHIFSYFLQLFNENGDPISKRLYKREDSLKYLPQNIKPLILPLVKEMTINLVRRIDPKIINRTSMELLNDKTMKRFNEISELLQNELKYELIWSGKNDEGKSVWKFKKNGNEIDLNEDTIEHFYKFNDDRIKKSLMEAEMLTNKLLKNNWSNHRMIDKLRK